MLTLSNLTWNDSPLSMCFSLKVAAGERVAILGPSGAGKSTLLSLIAGFLPADSGGLWLNGEDHRTTPPARRPVSMLFQENNLFPHLTVAQNIGLGLHPGLRLDAEQKQALNIIARRVGLQDYLTRLPAQLSGGQRQRIALARCLVRRQPLLLLDEPFSALDPALRQEMLQLVNEVCAERDITLLMVSHHIEDAARITPRSTVIVDGQVFWDGSTAALMQGDVAAARVLGITAR